MKPLHCLIALMAILGGLLGLVAGPLATVVMFLAALMAGAVIFVHTMNRQQQEEARQEQLRKDQAASPGGVPHSSGYSGPLVV